MKFHCDRCKTRYSIADERVRGKILKIRCKNCTAVITVREKADEGSAGRARRPATAPSPSATPPRAAAQPAPASALQGAFQQVMAPIAPSASDSFAPATLDEEWYVSSNGQQHGPFALPDAKAWVRDQPAGAELWCWSEEFDDWLPVEKVSHFRSIQRAATATDTAPAPGPSLAASSAPAAEPIAEPLPPLPASFEPAAKRAAAAPRSGNGLGAAHRDPAEQSSEDLDLDIGEASRVVNLAMLQRDAEALAAGKPADEPVHGATRLGKGSGRVAAIEQTAGVARIPPLSDEVLADATPDILTAKPRSPALPLLIGGGVLVALAVVIAFVAMSGGDGREAARKSGARADVYVQRVESLDFQFGDDKPVATKKPEAVDPDLVGPAIGLDKKAGKRRPRQPVKKVAAATTADGADRKEVVPTTSVKDPEVPNELSPADITRVSSRYQMSTTRCYERALKKDPFLKVSKLDVVITVAPSGVVSNLKMGTQGGPVLTSCLQHRIRAWSFPKSAKGITTQISIVFQSR